MRRRDFIRLAGGAALALPAAAHAQFNASRPITMVVPFPAGGGADILVRMLTKYMSENLSHPFIVQNVPGAGGGLAFGQVARATPDGHTLGWVSTGFPVMAATLSNLTFKPESDFIHICNVSENPFVLVVNPQVPVKSVKELVELAKAKPNTLNFAHNGAATLTNLVVELLKIQAGIDVAQVAYRGDNFSSRGRDRRTCAGDVLEQPGGSAARGGGTVARACRHVAEALSGRPRPADHGGVGISGLQGGGLAGLQRAGRHAPGSRRSPQCFGARGAAGSGSGRALSRSSVRSESARRPEEVDAANRCGEIDVWPMSCDRSGVKAN